MGKRSTEGLQNLALSAVTVPCSEWVFLPTHQNFLPSLLSFIYLSHHSVSSVITLRTYVQDAVVDVHSYTQRSPAT